MGADGGRGHEHRRGSWRRGCRPGHGLRVPEDLSVFDLHDFTVAPFLRPALSTVVLPLEQLGQVSMGVLLERLSGGPPREVMVHGTPRLVRVGRPRRLAVREA